MSEWIREITAIAVGGAIGALARFLVADVVYLWTGRAFPWGTLTVNVLGSLAMGLCYVLLHDRLAMAQELRAVLMVGFLGAFTTFSTFAVDTVMLLDEGALLRAGLNMLVSVAVCVTAAWLGIALARQF